MLTTISQRVGRCLGLGIATLLLLSGTMIGLSSVPASALKIHLPSPPPQHLATFPTSVSPINDAGALLSTTPTTIYDTWSLYGRILVSDPFGTPVSQGTVTMTVNGVPQCDFYREAGSSLCSAPLPWDSFNLRLSQGTYTVEVSYSGYGDLRPSTAAFTVNDVPTPTVTSVVTTTIDPCWIFCSESEWQATVSDAAFQDGADFWQLDTPYLSGQNDNIEFECDGKPVLLTGLSPGPDDTEVSSWVPANNYCPDNQASFVYQGDASYALSSG